MSKGESLVPVVLSGVLAVSALSGTVFYVLRAGHEEVQERSLRVLKWAVPLAVACAILRALASLAGRP